MREDKVFCIRQVSKFCTAPDDSVEEQRGFGDVIPRISLDFSAMDSRRTGSIQFANLDKEIIRFRGIVASQETGNI
jgi:hypothetical protein